MRTARQPDQHLARAREVGQSAFLGEGKRRGRREKSQDLPCSTDPMHRQQRAQYRQPETVSKLRMYKSWRRHKARDWGPPTEEEASGAYKAVARKMPRLGAWRHGRPGRVRVGERRAQCLGLKHHIPLRGSSVSGFSRKGPGICKEKSGPAGIWPAVESAGRGRELLHSKRGSGSPSIRPHPPA